MTSTTYAGVCDSPVPAGRGNSVQNNDDRYKATIYNFSVSHKFTDDVLVYATTALPFAMFQLRGAFEAIPRELEEAAMVDGAALGVGGYDETAWYVGSQYTLRNDNALKYRHAVSGVDVGAMYSVSEQPGVSASYGAMAMVPMGALTLGLAHLNDSAAVGERKTNLVAVKYK